MENTLENLANLSIIPNDILRVVYAECLRVKHEDNRAAMIDRVATDVLDAVNVRYVDDSASSTIRFPNLGDVRIQIDTYKGSKTKRALAITATAEAHPDSIVYGMIFMRRDRDGTWSVTTGPFSTTAGPGSLAFAGLCDFMNDVAKNVSERYVPVRTFDRRTLNPRDLETKTAEIGHSAAAEYFGISVYRLKKLLE